MKPLDLSKLPVSDRTNETKSMPAVIWHTREATTAGACVPNAFRNAMHFLGLDIKASEARRAVWDANGHRPRKRCSPIRWKDALVKGGYTAASFANVYDTVVERPMNLHAVVSLMRDLGVRAAVMSTRTPNHATALVLDGNGDCHIIDNGGWAQRERWSGRNINGLVVIIPNW